MRLMTKTAAFALALVATVAIASEATDPTVKARQDLMDTIGMNTKVLGEMAGGKTAFDADAAGAAKTALVAASADIAAKFEPQATDPKTTAKPEVWINWADFQAKATALNAAATAMDAATVEGVQAGMASVGGSCKACHSAYRS